MVSSIERFHCIQDSQLGPMVSSIERFHCIQDSQLGPNGVLYREAPLSIATQRTTDIDTSVVCSSDL